MSECRKVQELTKEFLEKLSKIKAFKERIISLKPNNNYESKRIRTKNTNNNMISEELLLNPLAKFSKSGDIKVKLPRPKKIPPLSNSILVKNESSKEKDFGSKIFKKSHKKPKILPKPKTSEMSRDKLRNINNNIEEKKTDIKSSNDLPKKAKEEPIKKIKAIAKINDELYDRLLNRPKLMQKVARSESPEIRVHSLENTNVIDNNSLLKKRRSLEPKANSDKKKKIKKKKLPQLSNLVKEIKYQYCVYPGNYGKKKR